MPSPDSSSYEQAATEAMSDPANVVESSDSSAPGQSQQSPQAASPQGEQQQEVWDGSKWTLKFRDKQIVPENRDQLVTWAQKGYAYNTLKSDLDKRAQELDQLKGKYGQLQQLSDTFESNPALRDKILQLYQETLSNTQHAAAAGDQQGVDQGNDVLAQVKGIIENTLQEKLAPVNKFQEEYFAKQAENDLNNEEQQLRAKFQGEGWDSEDSEGKRLIDRVLLTAAKYEGSMSLEEAYKLVAFDSVKTRSEAEALKKAAEDRQKQARDGIIASGANGGQARPRPAAGPTLHTSYNDAAQAALADWQK